jgi:multiple sugar transport system substrate-binding protein
MRAKVISKATGVIIVVSMLLMMVSACKSTPTATEVAPAEPKPTEAASDVEPTVAPTVVPTEAPLEEITLRVMVADFTYPEDKTHVLAQIFDETVDKYKADHPNVTLEFERVPWIEIAGKYLLSLEAGNPPDAVEMSADGSGLWGMEGKLLALNDYISPELMADLVNPENIMWDGKLFGLTFYSPHRNLYYNKALFEKAGLDPEKPPTTWDELIEFGQALNHIDGEDQWGFGAIGVGQMGLFYLAGIEQLGGKAWDENGCATYNNPEGVKVAEFYNDLINKYEIMPTSYPTIDDAALQRAFIAGKYGIILGGTWDYPVLAQGMDPALIGWGRLPIPEGGVDATNAGSWGWGVSPLTEHPAEAADFIISIQNNEYLLEWAENKTAMPVRKSMVEAPLYQDGGFMQDMAEYAICCLVPYYPVEDVGGYAFGLWEALQSIWSGEKSAQDALDEAAQAYNDLYCK